MLSFVASSSVRAKKFFRSHVDMALTDKETEKGQEITGIKTHS